MATIKDIKDQKDKAVAILNQKIEDAGNWLNQGKKGMRKALDNLENERDAVLQQAVSQAFSSDELAAALEALKGLTKDMNDVAQKMIDATTFIANVASLGTKAQAVAGVLKGNS